MKKKILLYAFLCLIVFSSQGQRNNNPYALVWSDEFNRDGALDSSKWRYESGFVRNNEIQWYQKENAFCKDGYLVITAKKEKRPNPHFIAGSNDWKTSRPFIEYTSSSVVMQKQHAFQYGKLEVRAKIDAQTGLWPAIWTVGVAGEWPSNGEVDIMEYYNNSILANYAHADSGRYKPIWDGANMPLDSLGGKKWAHQFHVWTLEWDEKAMKIFVDNSLVNEIDLSTTINKSDGRNPFKQPHYLLLNLALGGNRGGSLDKTSLPSNYYIDYVRLYQRK